MINWEWSKPAFNRYQILFLPSIPKTKYQDNWENRGFLQIYSFKVLKNLYFHLINSEVIPFIGLNKYAKHWILIKLWILTQKQKVNETFSTVFLLFWDGFICKIICKFEFKYSLTDYFPNLKIWLKHLQIPMVFKDCHLLQIQMIPNAELAPTICLFAIFYKIWCYQMLMSA